jgi:hypothetical protein
VVHIQYRVYLLGELGKLRNRGDADRFVASAGTWALSGVNLPPDGEELSAILQDDVAVDRLVAELSDARAIRLTELLSRWRRNSAYRKLANQSLWRIGRLPAAELDVYPAEPGLASFFADHEWSLVAIS